MKWLMKWSLMAAVAFVAVFAFAAIDLPTAKSSCVVGERQDGYVGLVEANASGDAKALVVEVNKKRRRIYQNIAKENGIDLADVEARAGQRAIEKTASGNCVQAAGGWRKK